MYMVKLYKLLPCFRRRLRAVLPAAVVATVLLAVPPPASGLEMRPICDICRRFCDTSPGWVMGYVPVGKRHIEVEGCSPFCFFEQLEDFENEPVGIKVVDHAGEMENGNIPLINAPYAWFVYDAAVGDDEKQQAPYCYAFRTKDAARKANEELEGEVLDWEEVSERSRELAAEWEPEEEDYPRNNGRPG
jgi:hypothetical protein